MKKIFMLVLFAFAFAGCAYAKTQRSLEDGQGGSIFVEGKYVLDPGTVAVQFAEASAIVDLGKGRRAQQEASADAMRSYSGMYDRYMQSVDKKQYRDPRVTELLKTLAAVRGKAATATPATPASPTAPAAPATAPDNATLPLTPTAAPAPTSVAPATRKVKGKNGKEVAMVTTPPPPPVPVIVAVGTDLKSGIAAARNHTELRAVFEREVVNTANPNKAAEFRNISRAIASDSGNPTRFEKLRSDLAAAYGQ